MSRFKKAALSCLIVLILLIVPTVTTFAASTELILPFTRPYLTGNNGYIELMFRNSSGTEWTHVIGWEIYDTSSSDNETYMDISLENGYLYFYPVIPSGEGVFVTYRATSSGQYAQYPKIYTGPGISTGFGVADLYAYRVYGNTRTLNISGLTNYDFTVVYSNENSILVRLDEIIGLLTNNSDIIENQDKNTQEIIDNQNQLQENEKIEAGNTGNSSSDQLTSVIPNDSEGFTNSLNSLLGAMSTTATDCNIKIPELKLPNIAGITPEAVLLEQQYFDLGSMFNIIPIQIMTLLRALFDIALVVFCFKELYSTIEYVLTLRKGGD